VRDGDAIGKEIAELLLGPAVEDELGHEVQIGSWVDVVRDAGGDDGEDGGGAGAAEVVADEEPILLSEDQFSQLALTAVNPAPLLVREVTELLVGQRYSPELVEAAAHAVIRIGKPLTTSVSTPTYRREMLRVFTRRALRELWSRNDGS